MNWASSPLGKSARNFGWMGIAGFQKIHLQRAIVARQENYFAKRSVAVGSGAGKGETGGCGESHRKGARLYNSALR